MESHELVKSLRTKDYSSSESSSGRTSPYVEYKEDEFSDFFEDEDSDYYPDEDDDDDWIKKVCLEGIYTFLFISSKMC